MNAQTKWTLDPDHCEIAFKVRHLMIAHNKGRFKSFDGTIYTTNDDFSTVSINLSITVSSIDTGSAKRDEHLKSAHFFDADQYKEIVFTGEGMSPLNTAGYHELSGNLTIKGITKPVLLTVKPGGSIVDPGSGNEKVGFTVSGKIKRSEWGLNWDTPVGDNGLVIGEDINIHCDIELIKN